MKVREVEAVALVYLAAGALNLAWPAAAAWVMHVEPNPHLAAEVRAIQGGMCAGAGLALGWSTLGGPDRRATGCVFGLLLSAGAALGRLTGGVAWWDVGVPLLLIEAGCAIACAVGLWRAAREAAAPRRSAEGG